MGVKGLLKELPGGDVGQCQRTGFANLAALHNRFRPADIDTGTLIFVCALRHKEAFNAGDYVPAAREFQRQIISMNLIYKWDYTLVFDGRPPEEKRHEHARRREKVGSVVIDSTFISICVVICKRHFVKYVVAPSEADMQVGRWQDGAVPVCRDSDEIAYGNRYVVFIDNWHREQFRVVDLNIPATVEMETKLPCFGIALDAASPLGRRTPDAKASDIVLLFLDSWCTEQAQVLDRGTCCEHDD